MAVRNTWTFSGAEGLLDLLLSFSWGHLILFKLQLLNDACAVEGDIDMLHVHLFDVHFFYQIGEKRPR